MPMGPAKKDPAIRFERRVKRTSSCWLWTGGSDRQGYGLFDDEEGRKVYAHRFSWSLVNGPIPPGLCVLHHCDNPPCVNPDHLYTGTQLRNMQDKVQRNRQIRGTAMSNAVLNPEMVLEIRKLLASGLSHRRIARMFSVAGSTIGRISLKETWSHVS